MRFCGNWKIFWGLIRDLGELANYEGRNIPAMMDYEYSKHAIIQFKRRGIDRSVVDEIIKCPQQIVEVEACVHVYQSIMEFDGDNYLVRIFVNICKAPCLVITGYRTLKTDKYVL